MLSLLLLKLRKKIYPDYPTLQGDPPRTRARHLILEFMGPICHQSHSYPTPQVYIRRWMSKEGMYGVVSLASNLFHRQILFFLVTKSTPTKTTRGRKKKSDWTSQSKAACTCYSVLATSKYCVQKFPLLYFLLPGQGRATSWQILQGLHATIKGWDLQRIYLLNWRESINYWPLPVMHTQTDIHNVGLQTV